MQGHAVGRGIDSTHHHADLLFDLPGQGTVFHDVGAQYIMPLDQFGRSPQSLELVRQKRKDLAGSRISFLERSIGPFLSHQIHEGHDKTPRAVFIEMIIILILHSGRTVQLALSFCPSGRLVALGALRDGIDGNVV